MGKDGVVMIEFKQIEDGRRRCIKTMIAVHGDDMIERVIPVAFPVQDPVASLAAFPA